MQENSSGRIDEIGNRYGRLLVLERAPNCKHRFAQWLCRCDCDNLTTVRGTNLRNGKTISCGCWQRDMPRSNTLPDGMAVFNSLFLTWRSMAKQRDYVWELDKEQVRSFTKQPCHYCGVEPSQVSRKKDNNGDYIYNGIDRINNAKGYSIDNVVSCCMWCNRAKSTRTEDEFYTWIKRVSNHALRRI